MKILIVTWGTRGDFQPYVALAKGLLAAGHEPIIAGHEVAGGWVRDQGIPFQVVGQETGDESDLAEAVERMAAKGDAFRSVRLLIEDYLAPGIAGNYEDLKPLARQADLVLSHFVQPAGAMAAEAEGVPYATAVLAPHVLPTRLGPPGPMPNLGPLNGMAWWLAEQVFERFVEGPIQGARQEVGFPPAPAFFFRGAYSPVLNLVAVSPSVFPPQPDWEPRHHMTGYWFLDAPPDFTPDPELTAFVTEAREAGEPLVALTFGSMVTSELARTNEMLGESARLAGARAIVQARPDSPTERHGKRLLYTGSVPHDQLFGLVDAVAHHGGAGTTAAALRAGKPAVVVAHLADQATWGHTLRRLGAGEGPLRRRGLRAGRLARALRQVLESPATRGRAADLGRAIRAEDGTGEAIRLLERLAAGELGHPGMARNHQEQRETVQRS